MCLLIYCPLLLFPISNVETYVRYKTKSTSVIDQSTKFRKSQISKKNEENSYNPQDYKP
jgi:hypothetical protein